jgi:hypothetical protein
MQITVRAFGHGVAVGTIAAMRVVISAVVLATFLAVFVGAADGRTIRGCGLKHHAKCAGVDLSGVDLRGVALHHADLRGANLERADLRGVNLRHANLRGARLRGAKLHHRPTPAKGVRLGAACSPNCEGADLSHADLTNAVLAGADLRYANLTGANLTGAELRSANVAYANLTSAVLSGADFTGAVNCATAVPAGVLNGEGCADDPAPVCYSTTPYSASTGTFTVTGNAFTQTSTYAIPDNDTQITSLTVNAAVGTTSVATTSTSRSFTVGFSGATTNTYGQSLTGLQAPWSTNPGTAFRSLTWNVADTGYGLVGAGRVRVNGAGTISTWSSDQRIRVTVTITGTTRVAGPCS